MLSDKAELLGKQAVVADRKKYYLKNAFIWIGFVISVSAFGYCVLGVIMTAWISATPGEHDLALLEFRAYLWMAVAFVFLVISIF